MSNFFYLPRCRRLYQSQPQSLQLLWNRTSDSGAVEGILRTSILNSKVSLIKLKGKLIFAELEYLTIYHRYLVVNYIFLVFAKGRFAHNLIYNSPAGKLSPKSFLNICCVFFLAYLYPYCLTGCLLNSDFSSEYFWNLPGWGLALTSHE